VILWTEEDTGITSAPRLKSDCIVFMCLAKPLCVTLLTCLWHRWHVGDMFVTSLTCLWHCWHVCDMANMFVTLLTCWWHVCDIADMFVTLLTCLWHGRHVCDIADMLVTCLWHCWHVGDMFVTWPTCLWHCWHVCDIADMFVTLLTCWLFVCLYVCRSLTGRKAKRSSVAHGAISLRTALVRNLITVVFFSSDVHARLPSVSLP